MLISDKENIKNNQKADNSIEMGPLTITLHRTCRVPHGKTNSLPASMGRFLVYKVSDFKGRVPKNWKDQEGAYFIPIYKHEALWIGFDLRGEPIALKVGAGMVNALTGERLTDQLSKNPEQDYLLPGHQSWIDGFKTNVGGNVFQFVSANLGEGETAEEQILGAAEFGGLQFAAFSSKVKLIPASRPREHVLFGSYPMTFGDNTKGAMRSLRSAPSIQEMGLGAGGEISQKIYPDPYTKDHPLEKIWNTNPFKKVYVYMVDPKGFEAITGEKAPESPISYKDYQIRELPWFGLFDQSLDDLPGSGKLEKLKKVGGAPDAVLAEEPGKDSGKKSGKEKKKTRVPKKTEEDTENEKTLTLW